MVRGERTQGALRDQRIVRWVVDFPLFYKVLVANAALVVAAAVGASWASGVHASTSLGHRLHWEFWLGFGGIALAAVVAVNYVLLRAALQPISKLTQLVAAIRRGDTSVRADRPLLGDPELNLLIETANSLLDELAAYRSRVEDLSERVTEQLEKERGNIARELHDETAQNLALLLVLHQLASQARDGEERTRAIEEVRQLIRLTLDGIRRMSLGLRPAILDDAGVPGALKWYVEEVMSQVLPEVEMAMDDSLQRLPSVVELALYRIAQEALNNVARHARASKVVVSLKQEADAVELKVSDDGVGFKLDDSVWRSRDHLGLFTITERARLAGGHAEITSEPGKGTVVLVRLPLAKPALTTTEGSGEREDTRFTV